MGDFVQRVGITADASDFNKKVKEVDTWLEKFSKQKIEFKGFGFDQSTVENAAKKAFQLLEGKFSHLNLKLPDFENSKNLKKTTQELLNIAEGLNILDQTVDSKNILKLGGASEEELLDLFKSFKNIDPTKTKFTGRPYQKRLEALYEKYPNGAGELGGSGKSGGFGASEDALNRIGDTLERIDVNVQSINKSIQTGAVTVTTTADGANKLADNMKDVAEATETAVKEQKQLGNEIDKNDKKPEKPQTPKKNEKNEKPEQPAKPKTPEKPVKPEKSQKTDEKIVPPTQPIDTSGVKKTQEEQKKLGQATEDTTKKIKEQQEVLQKSEQDATKTEPVVPVQEIDTATQMMMAFGEASKKAGENQELLKKNLKDIIAQMAVLNDFTPKSVSFKDVIDILPIPKGIEDFIKDPESINDVFKGLSDEKKFNKSKFENLEEKRLREIQAFYEQMQVAFPDTWEDLMASGYSKLDEILISEEGFDAIEGAFETAKLNFDNIREQIIEYQEQYNAVKSMLERGMSKEDILSRLDLLTGFTDEDIKGANLGKSGTADLYKDKIEQTKQRLQSMKDLKSLIEQEIADGKEISEKEQEFLNHYKDYNFKGNKVVSDAERYKTALEDPEAIRKANEEKVKAANARPEIEFSEKTQEAAKSQEKLAKSVREANKALIEQEQKANEAGKAITFHLGKLSGNVNAISHPFGDELIAKRGLKADGRIYGAGTGLYTTNKIEELKPELGRVLNDDRKYYAIDTSNLKMYKTKSEESAQEFFDFLHNLEQFCLVAGTGIESFDDILSGDIEEESLYTDFQKIFPNIQLSLEQFTSFIENMATLASESGISGSEKADPNRLKAFKETFGVDDIKTRFMKMLGYQGIDFSATQTFGGTQTGNVIFDMLDKDRILASGIDLDTVASEAEKSLEQQIVKVKFSKDKLLEFLRKYSQEFQEKNKERDTLLNEIAELESGKFNTAKNAPTNGILMTYDQIIEQSGQSKEDYLQGMLENDKTKLEQTEKAIIEKKAQINKVNAELENIDQLKAEGYKIEAEPEKTKTFVNKKTGQRRTEVVKEEIKVEEEDLKEAQKMLEEERAEAENAKKAAVERNKAVDDFLGEEGKKQTDKGKAKPKFDASALPSVPETGKGKGTSTSGTGESSAGQVVAGKVVYKIETTLDNVKDANKELTKLKKTNEGLTIAANAVADAINKEANALDNLHGKLTGLSETAEEAKDKIIPQEAKEPMPEAKIKKHVLTSTKPQQGVQVGGVKKEVEQKIKENDETVAKLQAQVQAIKDAEADAKAEIDSFHLTSESFENSITNKPTAYKEVKQYAENLQKAYEEFSKIPDGDQSTEAIEKINQYAKARVEFSKAYEKATAIGMPVNRKEQIKVFDELYEKHGTVSSDFEQAEKQAGEYLQAKIDKYEQQKTQTEQIITNLNAQIKELGSSETSAAVIESAEKTTPVVDKENKSVKDAKDTFDQAAEAKRKFAEANAQVATSANQTSGAIDKEKESTTQFTERLKILETQQTANTQIIEEQRKTNEELRKTIEDNQKLKEKQLQKDKEIADKKVANFEEAQRKELETYKQAAIVQNMLLEEDKKLREEQEAKAKEILQTKKNDSTLAKEYGRYGKDFKAVLNAQSVEEQEAAIKHLTETEERYWEVHNKLLGESSNTNIYQQTNLPEEYEKSTEAQLEGLKQRETAIAQFTASIISETEKQQEAFNKIKTIYTTDLTAPEQGKKDFLSKSLVDDAQTKRYAEAIDDVTGSLQRMQSIIDSMKNGSFDFGDINALRELLELRQTITAQIANVKTEDSAYKEAQSKIEGASTKKVGEFTTVLKALEKEIETIQTKSQKLINPDADYKTELSGAASMLTVIKNMIADINNNPLQFTDKTKIKETQGFIDDIKSGVNIFSGDYDSQAGIQSRINTNLTTYKTAYTNLFKEIKDSFKSENLGVLQQEIDATMKTLTDSITNLERATGLGQGEILTKYLNTNGGKPTAAQIEQQQKIRNALSESYRGLITDITNELSKVESNFADVIGEKGIEGFVQGANTDQFAEFISAIDTYRMALEKLKQIQESMSKGELNFIGMKPDKIQDEINKIISTFMDLNKSYETVAKNAKDLRIVDSGEVEKERAAITRFMKNNPGIDADAKAQLQTYFDDLQNNINNIDFKSIQDGWREVANSQESAGKTGETFFGMLETRIKSLGAYLLSFVSFYRVIGMFRDGISIIRELDTALTEMNKVSTESLNTLKEYQRESFDVAKSVGTTASQLQQSTADFLRLGETFSQAKESARVANELLTISEFDNIQDATTALVAISAAYEDTVNGLNKEALISKLNEIGRHA